MIIVMKKGYRRDHRLEVDRIAAEVGAAPNWIPGTETAVIQGDNQQLDHLEKILGGNNAVESVRRVSKTYKLASREYRNQDTIVKAGEVTIGGNEVILMAGPCAVESEKQFLEAARTVKACSGKVLRAGIFKPRTSPYSYQGIGLRGLELITKAKRETGLAVISEVTDHVTLTAALEYVDILQIGARNMQNYPLLRLAGRSRLPVLLKRSLSATIEEWLLAAEHILSQGNPNVILCERGIRTHEKETRNTLDLSAVPVLKSLTHLPVIVDPSHAAGKAPLVGPLACAAAAIGADGLLVEMHPNPREALCDGVQSLDPASFRQMAVRIQMIAKSIGRTAGQSPEEVPESLPMRAFSSSRW